MTTSILAPGNVAAAPEAPSTFANVSGLEFVFDPAP